MPRRPPGRSAQTASGREAELEALLAARERENAELRRAQDEALQRQTATLDILRTIASSELDLRQVLHAIVVQAGALFRAPMTMLALVERDNPSAIRHWAAAGEPPVGGSVAVPTEPRQLDPEFPDHRAVLER